MKKRKIRFDQRMYLFTVIALIIVSISMVSYTVISLQNENYSQLKSSESYRIEKDAESLSADFSHYGDLAISLSALPAIQKALENTSSLSEMDKFDMIANALISVNDINKDFNFIAILDVSGKHYYYNSSKIPQPVNFLTCYEKELKKSYHLDASDLMYAYTDSFDKDLEKASVFFFPIYSSTIIHKKLGYLCFSVDNELITDMRQINVTNVSNKMLINDKGDNVIGNQQQEIFPFLDLITSFHGNFVRNNTFYFYHTIRYTHFIVIHSRPRDNFMILPHNLLMLVCIAVGISFICIFLLKILTNKAYEPMRSFKKAMDRAGHDKDLSISINSDDYGSDFSFIADGFNSLMKEMRTLMSTVAEEEKQKECLKYNLLQSQIKPHFLYNTLECMHWQAISSGNDIIATMVLALGNYYKTTLSDGKDIITIKDELQIVADYLTIQNMRYSNIVTYTTDIEEEVLSYLIPKLTLQPLVENAIYHGIRIKENMSGELNITAMKGENDEILILVYNSGPELSEEKVQELNSNLLNVGPILKNYGTNNVQKRLQLLFGRDSGLHFERNIEGGVSVVIRLKQMKEIDNV